MNLRYLTLAALLVTQALATLSAQPPPPPATSVYAWFAGDLGLQADASGFVTLWRNLAATGTPASRNLDRISGTPQSVRCATPGGARHVLRCDGADGVWAASANFGTLTAGRTLVAYCRVTSTNDGFLFDGSANSPGLTRAQVRGGWWQAGLQPSGGGSNPDTNTWPLTPHTWQAHVFTFEPVAGKTRVSHEIPGLGSVRYTNSLASGLGGLILGRNVAAIRGLAVDLAEFLVYDRVLDQTESQVLTDYLAAKWGSPAEIPPPNCTAAQTSQLIPAFGLHPLLEVQVRGPGLVTNLTFTLDGTTDPADIASIDVYYTGADADFRPRTRFGTYSGPLAGELAVNGSQELSTGVNRFWLAVEPRRNAKWGHALDATLLRVAMAGEIRTPEVGAPPEFLTLGNGLFSTILRKAGDDGVHTYRIPGLVATPRGTLIAVFDLRWENAADLPANVDVGCLRSTDNGNTWHWATNTKAILDFDKTVAGSNGNGVGDPAVLVDRHTGAIWVAALWSFGNHAYAGSGAGLGTNQTGQYVLTRSDDDGLSWSAPINITAQAKINPNWGVCFQGPGHGIQLRDGTLLFPSQHTDPGGGNARAFFIYSTDNGSNWLASPDVNPRIPPQLNENQMVELDSGQIMISSRAPSGGGGQRVWSTYTPGATLGNGTWSPLAYRLPDPVCQASFIRLSSKLDGAPRSRLLFANPASTSSRLDMTVRMSEDEGQTWTVARRIDSRPAAYSDLAILADRTVGLLYETGNSGAYETLTFVRFHLDWLTRADLDSDGDGLSDYYETINGLNNGLDDAQTDLDGDGASNADEFEAGTMANNPLSVLEIRSLTPIPNGLNLQWSSVPGVFYSLLSATDPSGAWYPEPGAEHLLAAGAQSSLLLPAATADRRCFRIATPTRR